MTCELNSYKQVHNFGVCVDDKLYRPRDLPPEIEMERSHRTSNKDGNITINMTIRVTNPNNNINNIKLECCYITTMQHVSSGTYDIIEAIQKVIQIVWI